MNTLQTRWSKEQPAVYDKENRIVRMYIAKAQGGEEGKEDGYQYTEVQIDKVIDYSHIKSQLIEAAYPQKDEFGAVINAVHDILSAVNDASSFADFKKSLATADIEAFNAFCQHRDACSVAAKEVLKYY